jgi:pre-mRNA-splicing factor CWC22
MLIECCCQERTYMKFYGLLGERLGKLNRVWADYFVKCFEEQVSVNSWRW